MYIQNISLERPDFNPKNSNLNLDIDWSVDFKDENSNLIRYTSFLKNIQDFKLDLKVKGIIKLKSGEVFSKEEFSQFVFDNSVNVLMNLISLTRENHYYLTSHNNLGSNFDNIHNLSKNEESGEKIYTNINQLYY